MGSAGLIPPSRYGFFLSPRSKISGTVSGLISEPFFTAEAIDLEERVAREIRIVVIRDMNLGVLNDYVLVWQSHASCANRARLRTYCHPFLPGELKRKKPALQKQQAFHHNVYVILLSDAVAKHRSILRLNPKRDPLKPCVYVGMTGIPVDHRFENHKNGYKSAWVVRKYGVRLMPELYEHLNPMPFEAAVQMESELAEDLRVAGYTVTGGH